DDEAEDDEGFGDHQVDQDLTEGFGALGEGAGTGRADGRLGDAYGDGRQADGQARADSYEPCADAGTFSSLGERHAADDGEDRETYENSCELLHYFPPTNLNGVYGRPASS